MLRAKEEAISQHIYQPVLYKLLHGTDVTDMDTKLLRKRFLLYKELFNEKTGEFRLMESPDILL